MNDGGARTNQRHDLPAEVVGTAPLFRRAARSLESRAKDVGVELGSFVGLNVCVLGFFWLVLQV